MTTTTTNTTVLVTGGSGMVGSHIKSCIQSVQSVQSVQSASFVFISSKDYDLTDRNQVESMFNRYKPTHVIHLAAKVGGLYKNLSEQVSMFRDNILMNENVLEFSHKYNIKKGIFCLSSCIYPHTASRYPMSESQLHESEPHSSNESYGYAKRMMELQCRNYNKQYGTNFICVAPVNLYGQYDNFNLQDSHVIPGLIHKFYIAKRDNNPSITICGTGRPLRQFMHATDFAVLLIRILGDTNGEMNCGDTNDEMGSLMNISTDDELTIKDVVDVIKTHINYTGEIVYDSNSSDGCLRKTISNAYFRTIYPDYIFKTFNDGIKETIEWFNIQENVRL